VDSGSSDGSLEVVKEVLSPLGAKFLHHPPGLYQSWNAGIAAATSPWCYISTVEDPVLPGGLTHLYEFATKLDSDVLISPPEMRSADGTQHSTTSWPGVCLENSFASANLSGRVLSRTETIVWMCGFPPSSLLGSSASNLYRTSFLQKNPFPTDYGMAGDTAWAITVSPFVKTAFTPTRCAQFFCQTQWTGKSFREMFTLKEKLDDLAYRVLKSHSPDNPDIASLAGWFFYYRKHLNHYKNGILKYEGGILNYFQRAFKEELGKFFKKMNWFII